MRFPRASGLLLHITSLPSPFGIGDLGPSAYQFADFLESAGQHIWQVLPLSPPAHGNSPYSCYSAIAGNPTLVSPRSLVADGLLDATDKLLDETQFAEIVDFSAAAEFKQLALAKAFANGRDSLEHNSDFGSFCSNNAWWLDEFARFESLMHHFGTSDWSEWPKELVQRHEDALVDWDERLAEEITYSKFKQFVFDRQWTSLKDYANQRGIRVFGDMPIFVARESADVWANQDQFHLNEIGQPTLVAGVPPDYFSETGQRWGNPLYRWDVMAADNYAWWTSRFRRALEQFDLLRVDHFRGFESYWEIPAESPTAQSGQWKQGPGQAPFLAARESLGELPIIAEDLGLITQQVHDLRDALGFPPMRVMQFGFDQEHDDFHRPNCFPEHSVAYTGTHDNDTTMGWYNQQQENTETSRLLSQFLDGKDHVHLQLIQLVLNSAADTAIVPMQDLLGLGSEARMNTPGEPDGNWLWRVPASSLTADLAATLRTMTETSNR